MKKYTVTESQRDAALNKVESAPHSLVNDSITYRAGYIQALTDLGMIDGLSAARTIIEVESMEGWNE